MEQEKSFRARRGEGRRKMGSDTAQGGSVSLPLIFINQRKPGGQ